MILIALGANLPSVYGSPEETLKAAMYALEARDCQIIKRSSILTTPSWPDASQPPFKNAVIAVQYALGPVELLELLHEIERDFGRVRGTQNAPRVLDLDLIAYNDVMINENDVFIPHPRLHERGFVLFPLKEVASDWVHPVLKRSVADMIAALPESQKQNLTSSEAA